MESTISIKSLFKRIRFSRLLIHENHRQYRIFNYIVSVHLATWSSIWFSFVVFMVPLNDNLSIYGTLITACIVDLIFIIKMFISSHLTYVEPESGILVTDVKLIQKRYFYSIPRFWFDLFTTLPFNLIIMFTTQEHLRFAFINRMFRFWYLFMYYAKAEQDLNVKLHLRWVYYIYGLVLNMQAAACIW